MNELKAIIGRLEGYDDVVFDVTKAENICGKWHVCCQLRETDGVDCKSVNGLKEIVSRLEGYDDVKFIVTQASVIEDSCIWNDWQIVCHMESKEKGAGNGE